MLSVVLYGRNDNHGYNLHKRGAISLNAIAHLLRDPDDELIFVDYNTPDDLPTFPEAIADTLTDQARARLRILRLRPAQHARYAAQTHLMALEPIARNVAVRRSNPANRWVLSTNTDMIFAPRQDEASLGDLVSGLGDGFYHLPRFELPEALWESLDRRDAPAIIRSAGHWGLRFHLDEVVRSAGDNLFDGPGDFQLFLREDLFAIGGFDEAMLKGWHVDANVARRMRLKRGKVTSAEHLLRGYHCDHTRQASPYHKGDRVENDSVRFVDSVDRPEIAAQIETFGLAGEAVEEVRLGTGSTARYLAGLEAAVPHSLTGSLETAYVADAFGQLAYPLEHVLPYLLDLVSCIPQDAKVAYLGARPDTYAAFTQGWRAMGGVHDPVVPREADWLSGGGPTLETWAAEADVFVFEVGAEQATSHRVLSPQERARLWLVNHGLDVACQADMARQAKGAPARRAIVVNGIHNSFEAQLFRKLSVTLTPFSSRIRHGFIVDPDRAPVLHPAFAEAAQALGRRLPFLTAEVAFCRDAFEALLASDTEVPPEARSTAGSILALAGAGAPGFAASSTCATEALNRLAAGRAHPEHLPLGIAPYDGSQAASRLVRLEDWADPAFRRMANTLFPVDQHDNVDRRQAWTWERVVLALNLSAAQPLLGRPRVLVAAELPELLAVMLSNLGAQVDIADPRALAEGRLTAIDWRSGLMADPAAPASAQPLGLIDDLAGDIAAGLLYDAVAAPQNALFARGRDNAAGFLRTASALLKPEGHLGLGLFALVNDVPSDAFGDNITFHLLQEGRLAAMLAEAGLRPSASDFTLTPGALDTLSPADSVQPPVIPSLILRDGAALRAPCVLAFTKTSAGDGPAWAAVDQAIRQGVVHEHVPPSDPENGLSVGELHRLQLVAASADGPGTGSIMRQLSVAADAHRTPMAIHINDAALTQIAILGPIGHLGAGEYVLRIQGRGGIADPAPQAFIVTQAGELASGPVLHTEGDQWVLPFEIPGDQSARAAFALRIPSGFTATILDIIID